MSVHILNLSECTGKCCGTMNAWKGREPFSSSCLKWSEITFLGKSIMLKYKGMFYHTNEGHCNELNSIKVFRVLFIVTFVNLSKFDCLILNCYIQINIITAACKKKPTIKGLYTIKMCAMNSLFDYNYFMWLFNISYKS